MSIDNVLAFLLGSLSIVLIIATIFYLQLRPSKKYAFAGTKFVLIVKGSEHFRDVLADAMRRSGIGIKTLGHAEMNGLRQKDPSILASDEKCLYVDLDESLRTSSVLCELLSPDGKIESVVIEASTYEAPRLISKWALRS